MKWIGSLCLLSVLLLPFSFSFFPSASAANVQLIPRASSTNPGITLKGPYGQVNITNTQILVNGPNVYANGTIWISPNPPAQTTPLGEYQYMVKSYGNGTMVLRFSASPPLRIVSSNTASMAYSFTSAWEQITYTSSQTSSLVLDWTIGPTLLNAAVALAGFLTIISLAYWRWSIIEPDQPDAARMKIWLKSTVIVSIIIFVIVIFASVTSF